MPMTSIRLHGPIGERFGRHHRFDVQTPAEALRALRANCKGIEAYMLKHNEPGYRVWCGTDRVRKIDRLFFPVGARVIRIMQVPAGSGTGLEILLGSALIGSSYILTTEVIAGAVLGTLTESYITAIAIGTGVSSALSSIGFGLLLSGVSSLLFKPPKASSQLPESPNNQPSYVFNGAVNTLNQGGPVPLAYGRIMAGSAVVSGGFSTEELPL